MRADRTAPPFSKLRFPFDPTLPSADADDRFGGEHAERADYAKDSYDGPIGDVVLDALIERGIAVERWFPEEADDFAPDLRTGKARIKTRFIPSRGTFIPCADGPVRDV